MNLDQLDAAILAAIERPTMDGLGRSISNIDALVRFKVDGCPQMGEKARDTAIEASLKRIGATQTAVNRWGEQVWKLAS